MRFLRRGGGEAEQPIEQRLETFWAWWAGARDGIAADIERGTVAGRAPEISSAVDALHSKLAWELSPGSTAKHSLVVSPEVLLFDELSMGLAPLVVAQIFEQVEALRDGGRTIVLVEQYLTHALRLADLCYVLAKGRVAWCGEPGELHGSAAGDYLAG